MAPPHRARLTPRRLPDARETQGSPTTAPTAGSYSGNGFVFYVSPDASQVEDVSLSSTAENCAPGGAFIDSTFSIPSATIGPDGSFTASATQTGQHGAFPATFTYTFNGHFHGTTASGIAVVAGQWREDVTYTNGSTFTCSSNTGTWTAERDTQGTQTQAAPPIGTYTGNGFTNHVASGGTQMSVSLSSDSVFCSSGESFIDSTFAIPSITIGADGSFSGSATQTGVHDAVAATFTYTFNGHFHGPNSSGTERVAGQWREDVTFNNGTPVSCTTDTQPFTMFRTGA